MKIKLKLYASSKFLSDNDTLNVELPNNSTIGDLRNILGKIISEKRKKFQKNDLDKLREEKDFENIKDKFRFIPNIFLQNESYFPNSQ